MRQYFDVNRVYRDKYHSKISGVCAGLARHWQQPRWLVRVLALLCLFVLPMVSVVAYFVAALLLPAR